MATSLDILKDVVRTASRSDEASETFLCTLQDHVVHMNATIRTEQGDNAIVPGGVLGLPPRAVKRARQQAPACSI